MLHYILQVLIAGQPRELVGDHLLFVASDHFGRITNVHVAVGWLVRLDEEGVIGWLVREGHLD